MNEFCRTEKIIGIDNINKLSKTNVLLVGIGGVGGSTLEMLVRSGINNITIVDFDMFEESNLNRQILSLNTNINKRKVDIAKERAVLINSNCKIITYSEKVDKNFINKLNINYDYIIDACDDVKAKVSLIKYAINNNIKIITCCGTGNRIKPELLKISNIWKTQYDPLAKKLRHELRKENVKQKIPVVCSDENPLMKTSGFVGSMAMVPNAAGILLASYVINNIIDK